LARRAPVGKASFLYCIVSDHLEWLQLKARRPQPQHLRITNGPQSIISLSLPLPSSASLQRLLIISMLLLLLVGSLNLIASTGFGHHNLSSHSIFGGAVSVILSYN